MANGFFSRFRRQPATAANAPTPQAIVNAKNNANTTVLSNALKNYVKSIRNLRNTNPYGLSRNTVIESTAANRNKINRAIANYVMNVNKAKYLNNVARQAIPMAQAGAVPETAVAPVVNAAAQQNNTTAQAAQEVQMAAAGALTRRQGLITEATTPAAPELSNKNNKRNILKTLTNANLANNTKINATIKKIRGMNPNANWANVNANGFTNAQKKVLNGLKQGKNYVGLKRQSTPAGNVNIGSLFASTQAPLAPVRQAPPPPSKN
jgi:hypothetical protein